MDFSKQEFIAIAVTIAINAVLISALIWKLIEGRRNKEKPEIPLKWYQSPVIQGIFGITIYAIFAWVLNITQIYKSTPEEGGKVVVGIIFAEISWHHRKKKNAKRNVKNLQSSRDTKSGE